MPRPRAGANGHHEAAAPRGALTPLRRAMRQNKYDAHTGRHAAMRSFSRERWRRFADLPRCLDDYRPNLGGFVELVARY